MDEHNNLRAALQWALDQQEAEMALKLAGCLWRFWWMHGHISEGRAWLEKALAIPSEQNTSWRAKALNGIGILARSQGDYANARIFLEECLEIRRSLEDRAGVASVLNSLGGLALYQGDYETAYQYHEEGLAYLRETGDTRDIAVSLNNLAMVAQERSEFAQAEELYSKSLALLNQIKDAHSIAAVLANTGALMNDRGDASKAEAFFKDSLSISKDLGRRDDIIECLEGFANAAAIHQKPHRAVRLLGAAQAIRETISAPMPPYKYARYQRFMERVTTQLDQETLASELRIGKEMSLEEAIDYALNSP